MTPSEVFAAWRAGARAVKLFPAATLGVGHVRAMAAVLPADVSLLAVGGVSVANLGDWRRAGCAGAGLGSDLFRPGQAPETRPDAPRPLSRRGTRRLRPRTALDAPASAGSSFARRAATPMDDASLIGLDWGSSRLRAYLLSRDGAVLETRSSDAGASRLAVGAAGDARAALFERHLRELVADWLAPGRPIIACGMVGSAHGWREAAYVPCPVDLNDLHRHLTLVRGSDGLELWIVPGASYRPAALAPDVMRGEETQVIGALAQHAAWATGASIVLPGNALEVGPHRRRQARLVRDPDDRRAVRRPALAFGPEPIARGLDASSIATHSSAALPHRAMRVAATFRTSCSAFARCTCSASGRRSP